MNFWNNLIPNFIHDIRYENLISNTKNEIEKMLKYCDLEWNDNCLNFQNNTRPIKTASDIQARNKIYKTSINSWKNYQKDLNLPFKKLGN